MNDAENKKGLEGGHRAPAGPEPAPTGAGKGGRLKSVSYLKAASATTLNVALNAATLGRYVWLEGRVRRGVFRNWARRFRYAPERFVEPATEQEAAEAVRSSENLRVFGSGHSFNGGVVSDGTLLSLDKYSGPVEGDSPRERSRNQMTIKGGTRVRDVVRLLVDQGLAFEALPSHDAQSIGGILSTDVHGTGVKWGFVSDSVVGLKLIDGKGDVHECQPSDDLFKAAIGGVGAVGLIIEVVVQGVRRFNVAQRVSIEDLAFVERNLGRLLREHDHLSLYLFPFSDKCQVNTWDRTDQGRSPLGGLREFMSISLDALLAAWSGISLPTRVSCRRWAPAPTRRSEGRTSCWRAMRPSTERFTTYTKSSSSRSRSSRPSRRVAASSSYTNACTTQACRTRWSRSASPRRGTTVP